VCMIMDGVGFAIRNLLKCPSFERPQALHNGVFSLPIVPHHHGDQKIAHHHDTIL